MITRVYSISDVMADEIRLIGDMFSAESGQKYDHDHFILMIESLLAGGQGVMFEARFNGELVGAICATLSPSLFSTEVIAVENFWFLAKYHRQGTMGIRMYNALLDWAAEIKVSKLVMAHMHFADSNSATVSSLYERLGLTKLETYYCKELKWPSQPQLQSL
jgi:hypothetical protein